jgi:hypothetical protein
MNTEMTALRTGVGALAGLAGTFVIQGLLAGGQKWAPQSLPPLKRDPGEFMIEKAENLLPEKVRGKIPTELEKAAAKSLALGYGATFGALYAGSRPETRNPLLEGTVLGLVAWGAGYVGWLPRAGLMPPLAEQKPEQIAGPIISHILFGIATVGLYRFLRRL